MEKVHTSFQFDSIDNNIKSMAQCKTPVTPVR